MCSERDGEYLERRNERLFLCSRQHVVGHSLEEEPYK